MSHKNAKKMINIRKYYLVHVGPSAHFGSIRFTLSYSVLVLFSRRWSYSVLFVPTRLILVHSDLFSPLWSYSVLLVPIWSYFVHSIHYVPFGPFVFTSVHLDHFDSFVFTLIHFNLLRSIFVHLHIGIGRRHV